jgi:hypothetical protein
MGLLEDSGTGWLFLTQRPVKLTWPQFTI